MATPIGTNEITAISRRHLVDRIVDNVYTNVPAFFRLNRMNKKKIQGGTQIEIPILYARMANGGWYQGFDLLDTTPTDNKKNAAWDWRQAAVVVTVDDFSLTRANSPLAVANLLSEQFRNAEMEMAQILDLAVWSDATTNTKMLDGLKGAVDDGTVASTYGGLSRTSNTWWKSQIDSATTTLTLLAMESLMGKATQGGRSPTVIFTTQFIYDRYWNLVQPNQAWPSQPGGQDVQLAQAGFTNLVFNGVPIIVGQNVPANHVFFLNEAYLDLWVQSSNDFQMDDFIQPPNQLAYTAHLKWYGQLTNANCARQAKMTAITA